MLRLDELFLGKIRASSHFDPAQPEGVFKLCECRHHVITWDRDRCPSCEGHPVLDPVPGRDEPLPDTGKGGSGPTVVLPPVDPNPNPRPPPQPDLGHTRVERGKAGEVTITLCLKPKIALAASPTVKLMVGDVLVLLVENGTVTPHANSWWDVKIDTAPPSARS